jgi:Mg2+/Co2+ transporter CorB
MTVLSLTITAAVIIILLIASAFFSSSETALTAASEARMRSLAAKGNERASAYERLSQHRDLLISSLLIGNNLVNVLATSLATSVMITLLGESGVVIATILMTIILVLFAEVIPKTFAINHADDFALSVSKPVSIIVFLLKPFSISLRWIVHILIGNQNTRDVYREEELRGMIEIHASGSDSDAREQSAMLSSVLDLGEVMVDEVMTHRASVAMIDASHDIDAVFMQVMSSPYTRHPVYSGKQDNIIGVLHVKALLRAMGEAANNKKLEQIATTDIAAEPYFIPETTLLMNQLQAFRHRREHFAVVVDEYGDFRGIVTLEDILEEIVGEIDDEHDESITGIWPQDDGSWIIEGDTTIRDINRALDFNLPDDDAATLAGLVINESRTIPLPGQEFRFYQVRFRILRRNRNKIERVRIWPEPNHPDQNTKKTEESE